MKDRKENRKTLYCCGVIILLGLLLTARIFLSGDVSFISRGDNSVSFFSSFTHAANSIRAHSFPLWDPHTYSGHSFIGEMTPGLFYPPNLVLVLIMAMVRDPATHGYLIEAFIVLGLIAGALFTFWLCLEMGLTRLSAMFGGVIFAYSGFPIHRAYGQLCMAYSVIWVPFILASYFKSKRQKSAVRELAWLATAGFGLAMSVLAGHYMGFVMGLEIVLIYVLIDCFYGVPLRERLKPMFKFVIMTAFGVFFAAVQLLPTYEYMSLAYRWVSVPNPIDPGQKIPYSIMGRILQYTPAGLFEIFNPIFHPLSTGGVDGFLYSGVFALLLASISIWLISRRSLHTKVMTLVFAVGLFYSMGGGSFLHASFNLLSPVPDPVRAAGRISFLVHLAITVLAAFSFEYLYKGFPTAVERLGIKVVSANGIRISLYFAAGLIGLWIIYPKTDLSLVNDLMMTAFLAIFSFTLLWKFSEIKQNSDFRSKRWIAFLAFAIVLSDSYYFHISHLPERAYGPPPPDNMYMPLVIEKNKDAMDQFSDTRSLYRIANFDIHELKNYGEVSGQKMTMGFGASMPKKYFSFLNDLGWNNERINDLLSVKYVLGPPNEKEPWSHFTFKTNPSALPIFRLYHQATVVSNFSKARELLKSNSHDYRHNVILASNPELALLPAPLNTENQDSIRVIRELPNLVNLTVHSSSPGVLVFGDQFYPGWKAYRDNREVPLLEADTLFKSVSVPAGDSEVIFKYRPMSFFVGLGMTLATLFVYGLLIFAVI